MANIQRVGDLELEEDFAFQRREWAWERVGWAVILLVLLAALLGLFGVGPLSWAVTGDAGAPLRLEYERFGHHEGPTTLRVHLGPGVGSEGTAHIWLDRDYLEGVQVESVTPEPEAVEVGPDRLTYIFQIADPSRPTGVTFYLRMGQIGLRTGRVGLGDEPPLSFRQFVYP
jgi:hypothetical protein